MEKLKETLWEKKELLIAIFLVLLLLITGSYAWYQYEFGSEKIHIIKAGNLSLILDESASGGIEISNAVPTSDKTAQRTAQIYKFTLRNLGSSASNYTLYLDNAGFVDGEKPMQDSFVKFKLTKNTDDPRIDLISSLGEPTNRILDSGTIAGKTENDYTLQVWIDQDVDTEVMGTIFYTKIRVVAESSHNPETPTVTGNENIQKAVSYDPATCPTGEEATCEKTDCIENSSKTCEPGTIIQYAVNDTTTHYFYVLHDDGDKLTLQQRENIVNSIVWHYSPNGAPLPLLSALDGSTATSWTNVNAVSFTLGETAFLTNANTICSATECTSSYPTQKREQRARPITVQELIALGCGSTAHSCPEYLYDNSESGGYWTLSAEEGNTSGAWTVGPDGNLVSASITSRYGARAVIEINK